MKTVQNIENKLRKRDILISHEDLFSFYKNQLSNCYDIRSLKHLLKEKNDDSYLRLNQADLYRYIPCEEELALYPDRLKLGSRDFTCEYQFDPGKQDDGLTVKVPLSMVPEVSGDELDWLVPGLQKEKIAALIKGLPKSYRKQLVPVANTVDIILSEMPKNKGAFADSPGKFHPASIRCGYPGPGVVVPGPSGPP